MEPGDIRVAAREIRVEKYIVKLTEAERIHLQALLNKGKSPAKLLLKARILLKADESGLGESWSDGQIVKALDTNETMVWRVRRQLVEEGLEAVLSRKQRASPAITPIFDGEKQARLTALACSNPPEGRARWTLRLLEEKVVELGIVERASDNTIGRILKKNILKPHLKKQWVIPPDANADFVACMEDVLDVYRRPHDPKLPVVCLDETSKQLTIETRAPIVAAPGRPARHDYEYERNGTAALFMIFAPLEGRRRVEVRERRTAVDYAHVLKEIADVDFSDAEKIVLVQDNLNTHKPASLYQAFPAAEARRLAKRFEWHYTPKHGSWLDMAESELSVLSSQCLDRRIPNIERLTAEVASWTGERNAKAVKADWQFTTDDARIKLKRLYPQFE